MGISILLVIMCHTPSLGIKVFSFLPAGLIGTDVFIFLSGYSLGFAINKYPLSIFYARRIARIYPMFLILAIFVSLQYIYDGGSLSFWEWLSNLTFVSFYSGGGISVDWYLSISVILYFLFPILNKKMTLWLLVFISIACFVFQYSISTGIIPLDPVRAAGYARIPMFCWGIFLFNNIYKSKEIILMYLLWGTLVVVSILCGLHFFWITDVIAPFFILLLVWTASRIVNFPKLNSLLEFLGKYTIEIYVANFIATRMCKYLTGNAIVLLVYILLTIVLAVLFVQYNKIATSCLFKIVKL